MSCPRQIANVCQQVTVEVSSSGSGPRTYTLTRQRIAIKPVTSQMCGPVSSTVSSANANGKLAYVRVAKFNNQTTESTNADYNKQKTHPANKTV